MRTACTNEDEFEGRFWCATKVDSNLETIGDNWGYCSLSGSCPLENQNQNEAPKTIKTTTVAPNIFRKRTTTKAPIQKVRTGNVEKILKGSLDSIPSPSLSVKIQIVNGKVCLRCKGKTLLGVVNKLLNTKSLLTSPSNVYCFALLPQVNFPANYLNFH